MCKTYKEVSRPMSAVQTFVCLWHQDYSKSTDLGMLL